MSLFCSIVLLSIIFCSKSKLIWFFTFIFSGNPLHFLHHFQPANQLAHTTKAVFKVLLSGKSFHSSENNLAVAKIAKSGEAISKLHWA